MRPLLLFLSSLPTLHTVAQRPAVPSLRLDRAPITNVGTHEDPTDPREDGDVLWSEDLENGLGGWAVNTPLGLLVWKLTNSGNTGGTRAVRCRAPAAIPAATGSWPTAMRRAR